MLPPSSLPALEKSSPRYLYLSFFIMGEILSSSSTMLKWCSVFWKWRDDSLCIHPGGGTAVQGNLVLYPDVFGVANQQWDADIALMFLSKILREQASSQVELNMQVIQSYHKFLWEPSSEFIGHHRKDKFVLVVWYIHISLENKIRVHAHV